MMVLPDVWPKQRANAKRKKQAKADLDYRARVRRNKTRSAVKASNARKTEERAKRAQKRAQNKIIILQNDQRDTHAEQG